MRKSASTQKSGSQRVKALPWALLLQGGAVVGKRWRSLSSKDRQRLSQLVRNSRGRLSNLSSKERAELRKLVGKLDIKAAGKDVLKLAGSARRRRRSR